ncbi:phosphotransferase [Actinopolymorpha alba]|uniref:phosphotransferase n=1 Tax=Actinopolymorpha alba TaxID=533267 RepID=UPI0003764825|nr:phosphotransferase [Actinopolymorpha alba]
MRKPDVDFRALEDLLVRVFGTRIRFTFQRTRTGSSTQVYRVDRGTETFYVRIAEGPGDSFAPEVELHRVLHAAGVRVPAVAYYEPFDDAWGRSVMVTTEVSGHPLSASTPATAAVELGPPDAFGSVAHGDFDASHSFEAGGAYTG